jgi:hypothetical protein
MSNQFFLSLPKRSVGIPCVDAVEQALPCGSGNFYEKIFRCNVHTEAYPATPCLRVHQRDHIRLPACIPAQFVITFGHSHVCMCALWYHGTSCYSITL